MTRRLHVCMRWLMVLGMSGWLFQAGCARLVSQQLEVLFAAAGSPTLLYDSPLVDLLGPAFVAFFNRH